MRATTKTHSSAQQAVMLTISRLTVDSSAKRQIYRRIRVAYRALLLLLAFVAFSGEPIATFALNVYADDQTWSIALDPDGFLPETGAEKQPSEQTPPAGEEEGQAHLSRPAHADRPAEPTKPLLSDRELEARNGGSADAPAEHPAAKNASPASSSISEAWLRLLNALKRLKAP
jgi:hypothetical protein